MLRLKVFALALLATTAWSPLARADDHPLKGVALVIGESDYATLHKLDNPKRDARAMDDMLDSLGFSVDRVLDGDANKLRAEIADFIAEAKNADVALIYYSGHGIEAGGTDYLVPTDTDLKTPQTAGESLVPVSDMLNELARTVPVTIMLLDACRTNSFPEGQLVQLPGTNKPIEVAPTGLEALRGPVPVAKAGIPADSLGMVIGFAASPGEPALDGDPDGNSPYAAALLKHFAAGGYSFGDLMTLVSEEVYLKTKARQLPWVNSSLRRVLSFGKPVEPTSGDEAAIRDGRRQLLLTIAKEPEATQRYVETVAANEGVPLDALYGMLKVLGVDTSDPSQLDKQLLEGAKKLKGFMAAAPVDTRTDPELVRLSGLAQTAQDEGAMDLALKYRADASARADQLSASLDVTEANLKQDRLQLGTTYADHARLAALNFDFATAAHMWGKAFDQVSKWDNDLARDYERGAAAAYADLGNYGGDLAMLQHAVKLYDAAAKLTDPGSAEWASLRGAAGNALEILGERSSDKSVLEDAAKAVQDALSVDTRAADPRNWAGMQANLGVVLMNLGDREEGVVKLRQSADAFEASLQATKRSQYPLDWARTEDNLGLVLVSLGDRTGDVSYYSQAIDAHRAALEELRQDVVPLDWATAQSNFGIALARLGEANSDVASLEQAKAAFEASLAERPRARMPLDWAASNENLGNALGTLARLKKSPDLYREAIAAQTSALEEYTRDRSPPHWASLQLNLGIATKQLAVMTGDIDLLDAAIGRFSAALEVMTREASPTDWAQAEVDLGIATLARADLSHSRADLKAARAAYAAAYEIYGKTDNQYASYIAGKLKEIDKRLKS